MKHVRLVLEDAEYKKLIETKGTMTWKEYLMKDINMEG